MTRIMRVMPSQDFGPWEESLRFWKERLGEVLPTDRSLAMVQEATHDMISTLLAWESKR
jgi:hypothetical protein